MISADAFTSRVAVLDWHQSSPHGFWRFLSCYVIS